MYEPLTPDLSESELVSPDSQPILKETKYRHVLLCNFCQKQFYYPNTSYLPHCATCHFAYSSKPFRNRLEVLHFDSCGRHWKKCTICKKVFMKI